MEQEADNACDHMTMFLAETMEMHDELAFTSRRDASHRWRRNRTQWASGVTPGATPVSKSEKTRAVRTWRAYGPDRIRPGRTDRDS